jgi:hypothetical protein
MIDSLSGTNLNPADTYTVLKALSNLRYRARTVKGIVKETGLSEEVVQECLDNHLLVIKRTEPGQGNTLYYFRCNGCKL